MSDAQEPTFLVSPHTDPVVVKIDGKANYLNCNAFREFIETIIRQGKRRIFIDCDDCKGMDSTFLGILAGTAIDLKNQGQEDALIVGNLCDRNYELICNLGLQNLFTIERCGPEEPECFESLDDEKVSDAREVLQAHENLAQADAENVAKFQDVIAFLRDQVEDEASS